MFQELNFDTYLSILGNTMNTGLRLTELIMMTTEGLALMSSLKLFRLFRSGGLKFKIPKKVSKRLIKTGMA